MLGRVLCRLGFHREESAAEEIPLSGGIVEPFLRCSRCGARL